jgi:hypothetical protein
MIVVTSLRPAFLIGSNLVMNVTRCLGLLACVAVLGCSQATHPARGVRQVSWSIWTADSDPVAGLDQACVLFGTIDDEVAITFWSDGPGGSFGNEWDKTRHTPHFTGSITAQDGRKIDLSAFTADGKAGGVTIDDQQFDLANGAVFLIATANGEMRVKQSTLKLPQLATEGSKPAESSSETLRDFAKSDPEISKFFAAPRAGGFIPPVPSTKNRGDKPRGSLAT